MVNDLVSASERNQFPGCSRWETITSKLPSGSMCICSSCRVAPVPGPPPPKPAPEKRLKLIHFASPRVPHTR